MSYGYVPLQELIITYPVYGKQMYTWGLVRWGRLAEEIQKYKKECVDFFLLFDGREALDVSYATPIGCLVEDKVWSFDIFISKLGIVEDKM